MWLFGSCHRNLHSCVLFCFCRQWGTGCKTQTSARIMCTSWSAFMMRLMRANGRSLWVLKSANNMYLYKWAMSNVMMVAERNDDYLYAISFAIRQSVVSQTDTHLLAIRPTFAKSSRITSQILHDKNLLHFVSPHIIKLLLHCRLYCGVSGRSHFFQ